MLCFSISVTEWWRLFAFCLRDFFSVREAWHRERRCCLVFDDNEYDIFMLSLEGSDIMYGRCCLVP